MKTRFIIALMIFFAACSQKENKPVKPAGSKAPAPAPERRYPRTERKFAVSKIENKGKRYYVTGKDLNTDKDTTFIVTLKYPDTEYPGNMMLTGSIPERGRLGVIFTAPLSPQKGNLGELWIGPVDGSYSHGNTTQVVLL